MTTLTWDRHRGHASRYDVVALGFNYRIDEPRAAFASARLERLDEENAERGAHVAAYREALVPLDGVTPALPPLDGAEPSHHLFPVVLEDAAARDVVAARLAEQRVQTSVHYPPVHAFGLYSQGAPELPVTEDYARRTLTLPLFPHMTVDQRRTVVETLTAAVAV
jgi:dTDP-4-amino-4,6-dideoxygalactose transaminase